MQLIAENVLLQRSLPARLDRRIQRGSICRSRLSSQDTVEFWMMRCDPRRK